MRKFSLILLIIVIFSFSGCGNKLSSSEDSKKINVVATIFPQYDFTRQIAKDKINLKMLIPPGAESHSYEPTPQDIINIQKSDLFIYVGGENDEWIKNILNSIDMSNKTIISLVDCVDTCEEDFKTIAPDQEKSHDETKEIDEHVWTSPKNAKKITEKISEVLCKLDSKNSDFYTKNTKEFVNQLNILDNNFKKIVSNSKRNTLIFGDRFPFRYFVEEYGLNYYAAFPGCASQTDTNATKIAFLIDKIKQNNIPVVLKMELSNENIAKSLAEATNTKVLTMYSCHNAPKDDFENGVNYLDYMNKNLNVLEEALN